MKHQSFLLCAVLSFMLGGSPPLAAESPVHYVVPRSAGAVTIPYASLVATDPSAVDFLSAIQPSRGTLADLESGLHYTPDQAFRDWGTDNFQFTYLDLANEDIHHVNVHLLADLSSEVQGETGGDRDTTSGGNTVLALDRPPCQDCDYQVGDRVLMARGSSVSPEIGFAIWKEIGPNFSASYQIEATQRDGSTVQTALIPERPGNQKLIIDWWLSGQRSRNGGLLLRLDDEFVANLSGLDNNHHDGITWEYFEQYAEDNGGLSNRKHYSRVDARPVAFPARFVDTFEDNSVDDWPTTPGFFPSSSPLAVDSDAAVDGDYGIQVDLATGGAVLVDERPVAQTNFRARFHLDIGSTCTSPPSFQTGSVDLLVGKSSSQASTFSVALERVPDGSYRLRASSFDSGSMVPTIGTLAITKPQVTVDVSWWAATKPSFPDGGLRVLLFEGGDPIEIDLPLANASQRLESLQFGAAGAGTGAICLDEYESWWR